MDITIRKDDKENWGFVESFSTYSYDGKGSISVVMAITTEGKIAPPYVLRGNQFISADVIDREMGIEKYIKAKKPFYTLLSDGFIASVKAGLNFSTGEFLPDKTSYSIYKIANKPEVSINEGKVHLRKIHETSDTLDDLMIRIARQVSLCKGDRRVYLLSRL